MGEDEKDWRGKKNARYSTTQWEFVGGSFVPKLFVEYGKEEFSKDKIPPKRCGMEESESSDENNDTIPLRLNQRKNQEDVK